MPCFHISAKIETRLSMYTLWYYYQMSDRCITGNYFKVIYFSFQQTFCSFSQMVSGSSSMQRKASIVWWQRTKTHVYQGSSSNPNEKIWCLSTELYENWCSSCNSHYDYQITNKYTKPCSFWWMSLILITIFLSFRPNIYLNE